MRGSVSIVWYAVARKAYLYHSPIDDAPQQAGPSSGAWFGSSTAPPSSPFLFKTPNTWTPPPSFSPQKAFPQEEPDIADVSMSTAGSETPDASPIATRRSGRGRDVQGSPLRKWAYKSRDRDRSRDRERQLGRRRGLIRQERGERGESEEGSSEEEDDDVSLLTITCIGVLTVFPFQNGRQMSVANHYNLHLPTPTTTHNDLPYILSG